MGKLSIHSLSVLRALINSSKRSWISRTRSEKKYNSKKQNNEDYSGNLKTAYALLESLFFKKDF